MHLRLSTVLVTLLFATRALSGQDSLTTPRPDSARLSRLERGKAVAVSLAHQSMTAVRRGADLVFDVDSTVDLWSRRRDPASATLRAVAPVGFWAPVVLVAAEPLIWGDEAQDGHALNAEYARSATSALLLGFVTSRAAKHFVRRSRPCTGAGPNGRFPPADSALAPKAMCSRGIVARASFFSEHTMAVFAVAGATSFQAQRQNASNANVLTATTFSVATALSVARIYQRHHWLSDVIVGAAVGTGAGFLAAQFAPARPRFR